MMVPERDANVSNFGYTLTWWNPTQKKGIVKQKLMEAIALD
jgi:hypothetical protein